MMNRADSKWSEVVVHGVGPCSRRGHTADVIGENMYIFGGLHGFTKYLNDLYVFSMDTRHWIHLDDGGHHKSSRRPPSRAWHSSNVIGNGQILIYGGCAGSGQFLGDCWVLDTVRKCWFEIQCLGDPPLPRYGHSMVIIRDDVHCDDDGIERERVQLMMFGGMTIDSSSSNPRQCTSR